MINEINTNILINLLDGASENGKRNRCGLVVCKNESDRDANPDLETMPVDEKRIYDFPLGSLVGRVRGVSRKCQPAGRQVGRQAARGISDWAAFPKSIWRRRRERLDIRGAVPRSVGPGFA